MNPVNTSGQQAIPWRSPPAVVETTGRAPQAGVSERDIEQTLRRLERMSRLLDEAITIPGTNIRLGWDSVLGLIPVIGDGATTAISVYYIWQANRLGARRRALVTMAGNVAVDFIVGAVPLVGDLVDVAWRANRRNLDVLLRELDRQGRLPPDSLLLQRIKATARPDMTQRHRNYVTRPFIMP
jgi:hypothetical protein